jgi:MFS family permease
MIGKRASSGYALLGERRFRELWTANLGSTVGSVMLAVAASWLMTSLTDSTILVAMVQTATSLPVFFFSFPAGMVTDALGSRKVLLAAHFWMLWCTVALTLLAWADQLTPWLLLALLLLIGIGLVIHQAAWKPLLHDLVTREDAVAVVSLNNLSNKASQAIGPLIGGYLMGIVGAAAAFAVRAVTHVVMILALTRAPKFAPTQPKVPFSLSNSRRSCAEGWTHLRRSPQLYGPLIRCALVMLPGAGLSALLPLEARENIQTEVIGYGGLLAAGGLGTVLGASLTPLLQRHFRINSMATVALTVFALSVLGISQWDSMALDASFLFTAGWAGSVLSIGHQVSVQAHSPDELRGRMNSFYILTLQGSVAIGSLLWGVVAHFTGVSSAILMLGLVALASLLLVRRFPLSDGV